MAGVAERLRVDGPAKSLRLGDTFNKASKAQAYHTIRCELEINIAKKKFKKRK